MYDYPRWLVFQLLESCNLRCKMCYEWGDNGNYLSKTKLNQLNFDVVKQVIHESKRHMPYFELFGGEPLLYPEIENVLYEIARIGGSVDIPTNGTMLEKKASLLVDYAPRRLWISIDGPKEFNDFQRGKGVFDKAMNGLYTIHRLKQLRNSNFPQLGVTMVVTPSNYTVISKLFIEELDKEYVDWFSIEFQLYITETQCEAYKKIMKERFDIVDAISSDGLIRNTQAFYDIDIDLLINEINKVKNYCRINNINLIGYPKIVEKSNILNFYSANWNKMKERKDRCSLPWIYAEISANGNVTPCHTFYDYDIGNVYTKSLSEIWNSEKARNVKKYLSRDMLPICTACSRYYSDL